MKRRIVLGCLLWVPVVLAAEKSGKKDKVVPNPFEHEPRSPRIDFAPLIYSDQPREPNRKFIPDKRRPFIPGEKYLKEFKR